jgi:prephenate dehydrogenase
MTPNLSHVRVVGAGLIGTSIALALKSAGIHISFQDSDPRAERLARDLLGESSAQSRGDVPEIEDLCIIATPPDALIQVITAEMQRNPELRVMDISSIKTKPLLDVSKTSLLTSRFAPTHPMAGREVSGPESARGDLFTGRPWVLVREEVDQDLLSKAEEVIAICGGVLMTRSALDHDRAVAHVSHLPQIIASLLARTLESADRSDLELAGAGLRDTTRLADSDPVLWGQIIAGNAHAIRPLLISLQNDLAALLEGLDESEVAQAFIVGGGQGRARIPGKHGGQPREYFNVTIVIDDKPGQLAAIIESCAQIQVNIEDLLIEHTPGQETGLITLSFLPSDGPTVMAHLHHEGWKVHPSR